MTARMSHIYDDRCITCRRWVDTHPYCARLRTFVCEPCPDDTEHKECQR